MRTHFPLLALTLLLSASAVANDTLVVANVAPGARHGTSVTATGDVDHDGIPDFAETDGQTVYWISGASGAVLRQASLGAYVGLHQPIVGVGDLDGDGVPDLVAGRNGAVAYSGASAQTIWSAPGTGMAAGHALARLPDRDGDGIDEILVGVPQTAVWGGGDVIHYGHEGEGRAEILSGANGALLATISPPAGVGHGFGGSLCPLGDVDGDGQDDFAVAPFFQPASIPGPFGAGGATRVYSGATLAVICVLDPGFTGSTRVVNVGDVDGDGLTEVALAHPWTNVEIRSAATGALVRTHTGGVLYDRYGQDVVALGDIDADGAADYAIAAPQPFVWSHWGSIDPGPGFVAAYSGATGARLWTIAGTDARGRFGWCLAAVGDVNGDQLTDFAVGAPDAGRARVYSGSIASSSPNSYCVGGPTVGTSTAQLGYAGSTNVSANDFRLVVTTALAGQAGLFIYSRAANVTPFGAGWRCVGAPYFRLGPVAPIAGNGSVTRLLDLHAPPASGGPGAIGAGDTIYFQFLFRDAQPNHGGRNASNALAVTFMP